MTSAAVFADQFKRGLRVQVNVIFALLFENIRRLTGEGLIGNLADPVIKTVIFGTIWTLLGRTFFGLSPYLVMFVSFIPHMMFRRSMSEIPYVVRKKWALYQYPQVKPFDAIIASYIVTMGITMLGSAMALFVLYWFLNLTPALPNLLGAMEVIGITYIATFGIALIGATYSTISPAFDRVLDFARRPLIIISLVFHLGIDLPPPIQYYISWNPIADITEYFRYYTLGIPKMPVASLTYAAVVAIGLLAFGMMSYYIQRDRLASALR